MKKLLALFLLLSSCTTTPVENSLFTIAWQDDPSGRDWTTSVENDEFTGRRIISKVYSERGSGIFFVITDQDDNYIYYKNGDSYICSDYSLNVQHIFKKNTGDEYRYDSSYGALTSRDGLTSRNLSSKKGKIIDSLNNYDEMIIRTTDTCGNTITNNFKIEGMTHLRN